MILKIKKIIPPKITKIASRISKLENQISPASINSLITIKKLRIEEL